MKYQVFKRFIPFLQPYRWQFTGLFFLLLVASAGSLASPYVLKVIIDDVFPTKDYQLLLQVLGALSAIYVVRIAAMYASDLLYVVVSNRIMADIRQHVFTHMVHLPLGFFQARQTGELLHRVNDEVGAIKDVLSKLVIRFLNNVFAIAGLAVMLAWLNWQLFLVSLLLYPLVVWNIRYFQPRIHKRVQAMREEYGHMVSFFTERFNNIKLIQGYHTFDQELGRHQGQMDRIVDREIKHIKVASLHRNLGIFIVALSPLLVFGWGGRDVLSGTMTLGALVAFVQYLNRLHTPVKDLLNFYGEIIQASVSMERVLDMLDEPADPNHTARAAVSENWQELRFENTWFGHQEEQWVLRGLNLTLETGRHYALVGESGSGKSTLLNLIMRFYAPQEGQLLLGGQALGQLNLKHWREQLGWVGQEGLLFEGTVEDNIRYGWASAPEALVQEMAALVGIGSPESGLELTTPLGEKGNRISGGQRQRIAIARALMRPSRLLLLDEATSALDAPAEARILKGIAERFPDKTMIVITHRLPAVKHLAQIVYLQQGQVAEQGTHEELMAMQGGYHKLFTQQWEVATPPEMASLP